MAKVRRKKSSIAEAVKNGFQHALSFGSSRRNEVLEELRNEERTLKTEPKDNKVQMPVNPIPKPVPDVGSVLNETPQETKNVNSTPRATSSINGEEGQKENLGGEVFNMTMRELAEQVIRLNRENEIREMFNITINKYSKYLAENPTATNRGEYEQKLKDRKALLDEFDMEMTIIKSENQIDNLVSSTNNLLSEIENDFEDLFDSLKNSDNYSNVIKIINKITSKLSNNYQTATGHTAIGYKDSVRTLAELHLRYTDLTGKRYETNGIKFYSENLIRKIYGELESKIRENQRQIEALGNSSETRKQELEDINSRLDNLIDILPNLLYDPLEFERIQEETNQVLDKAYGTRKPISAPSSDPTPTPEPSKKVPALFTVGVEQHMRKIYNYQRNLLKDFREKDQTLENLFKDLVDFIQNAKNIDETQKKEVYQEVANRYIKKLTEEFGEEVIEYIDLYAKDLEEAISNLRSKEYGSLDFEFAQNDVLSLINKMKKEGSSRNINVIFDEKTQMLQITFPTPAMNPYSQQIVSDIALSKMNNAPSVNINEEIATERTLFESRMEAIYDEDKRLLEAELATLIPIRKEDVDRLNAQINALMSNTTEFPHLTADEKDRIRVSVLDRKQKETEQKYSGAFIHFMDTYLIPKYPRISIDNIRKMDPSDENFIAIYNNSLKDVKNFINIIENDENTKRFVKSIGFNEATQSIKIDFNNYVVEEQLVDPRKLEAAIAYQAARQNPTPTGPEGAPNNPVPPTPSNTPPVPTPTGTLNDMEQAKQDYINKLEEVNSLIDLINDLNIRLEAQAIQNFVNPENVMDTISMEKQAKALDQQVISLKIELSRDRLEFKKKFNKYILTFPEVKAIKIKNIEFNNELSSFVSQHDEMIVEAENNIIAMASRRNNPTLSQIERDTLNAKINDLLQFIDSENSLIARRLVAESANKSLDIVSLLQTRRANKKDIRERLRNIKDNVEPQVQQHSPAELIALEREFRTEIDKILSNTLVKALLTARNGLDIKTVSQTVYLDNPAELNALIANPKYNVLDKMSIFNMALLAADDRLNNILFNEKLRDIANLFTSLSDIPRTIKETDVIREDFDSIFNDKLTTILKEYPMIDNLYCDFDLKANTVKVSYLANEYDFETGTYIQKMVERMDKTFLSPELHNEYLKSHQITQSEPTNENQDIQVEGGKEPKVKISTRVLKFNPKNVKQIADRKNALVVSGDAVTISLLKNGIKIKYSQELREKLGQLNAKLSLVNKNNYRSRTSSAINPSEEEQIVGFKDEREIKPEDYRIEIRTRNGENSDVIYEYDLENISEELRGRTK